MIAATFSGADYAMIVVIVLLLFVLIFLAVAEMGLSRMTKPKASSLADQGHKSGKALLRLVKGPERWVNPVLLSVNLCQTVQATLTGIVASNFGVIGVLVGVILNVVVFFVLAEAVPKTYAVLHPERAALITARPISALTAFPPLRMISQGLISLTNVIIPGRGLVKGPFVSEQELLSIVETAADDDVIEHEERQLIESIIEFGDTVAREVMVPRPDIVTVDDVSTVTEALDIAIAHGYSRLPVLGGEDNDDVVGLAYMKDLIKAEREGRGGQRLNGIVRPVRIVPENKSVARLMREMQADKFHLAVVADEYGGIAGIITLEDCLEELVGEIVDEYDIEPNEVVQLPSGDYVIDGGMSVGDLNDLLEIDVPDEDWDTVAGFVFGTLGHVPVPGESVEFDGWLFTAEQVAGRRIRQVRISAQMNHDRPAADDGRDRTSQRDGTGRS
ncbi:MAG: hemolysin family protein [Acidimicrobiia bacterium]